MTIAEQVITVGMVVLGTIITRFLPFIIFPANKPTPKYIKYLGQVLPSAVIGLLVVYCFREVSFSTPPYGMAEIIAVISIILLHWWKRNMLLSIGLGTVIYMLLVQI